MPRRILLAVDLSYQVYRAAAAHPMLTSRRVFTGGLYGFLTTFAKIVRETKATHVVICKDSKPYKRSETYPEYKQLRKKSADDELLKMFNQSLKLVIEVLEECGLQIWGVEGFESDDLVGHCVHKYRHRFDHIYAASNDSDLYQLFWADNFSVYSKSITDTVNRQVLFDQTGLTPDQFMLSTALMGTHNDIAGITGVGKATSIKAVKDPSLLRKYRDSHGGIIDRNMELIRLPHAEFPRNTTMPELAHSFDRRTLYRCLSVYDIDVTASMIQAFEQINENR